MTLIAKIDNKQINLDARKKQHFIFCIIDLLLQLRS